MRDFIIAAVVIALLIALFAAAPILLLIPAAFAVVFLFGFIGAAINEWWRMRGF